MQHKPRGVEVSFFIIFLSIGFLSSSPHEKWPIGFITILRIIECLTSHHYTQILLTNISHSSGCYSVLDISGWDRFILLPTQLNFLTGSFFGRLNSI